MKNRIVLSNLSDTMEDALSNLRAFVRTVDGA